MVHFLLKIARESVADPGFARGGANHKGGVPPYFPKNGMKMEKKKKKIDPEGSRVLGTSSLDPPMQMKNKYTQATLQEEYTILTSL